MNAMDFGFVSKTGIAEVDRLLSRGGMQEYDVDYITWFNSFELRRII